MGILAPGYAHLIPSARPPLTLAEIFRHTCLQSYLQTSPTISSSCRLSPEFAYASLRDELPLIFILHPIMLTPKKIWRPPPGPLGGVFMFFRVFFWKFQKLSQGSKTSDMTSEGLGEMFEGDSADTWLVRAKCKHIPDELWRWQANIVTTIFVDGRQK